MEGAQFAGDRDVPQGVAEADRRGDVQRAPGTSAAPAPARRRPGRAGEVPDDEVRRDRVPQVRRVAGALERDQPGVRDGAATAAPRAGPTIASAEPWMTRVGQRTWAQRRSAVSGSFSQAASMPRRMTSGLVSRPQPTPSSICLVECGSVNVSREEEVEESRPVAQPVLAIPLGPSCSRPRFLVELVRALLLGPAPRSAADRARSARRPLTRSGYSAARSRSSPRAAPGHDDRLRPRPRDPAPPARRRRWPAGRRRAPRRGRSERPFPRRSNVTTRACRAKYGIWAFQAREWVISQVGNSRMVGSPVAVHLVEHADAVPLQVALRRRDSAPASARPRHRTALAASPRLDEPRDAAADSPQSLKAAPRTRG